MYIYIYIYVYIHTYDMCGLAWIGMSGSVFSCTCSMSTNEMNSHPQLGSHNFNAQHMKSWILQRSHPDTSANRRLA